VKIRILDVVAIIFSVAAVVVVSSFAFGDGAEPTEVSIQSEDGEFLYALGQSRELDIAGPLGITHVEIDGDRVRVTSSPCRDKICIAAGWLELSGDWTACLPNRVFVRVEGGRRDDGIDAQTY